jgi:DNA-binding response OmpR family regulator
MFEDHQRDDDHAHNGGIIGNPKRRIMIINDRDDINFTIRMVLEEDSVNKIRLDPFTDPFLALENFKSGIYDLILVDIRMPKMNGFDLYSEIRKLDSKVKVCFLTASDISEKFKNEMFDDELDNAQDKICFITIPIANDDLRKRIRELLELK